MPAILPKYNRCGLRAEQSLARRNGSSSEVEQRVGQRCNTLPHPPGARRVTQRVAARVRPSPGCLERNAKFHFRPERHTARATRGIPGEAPCRLERTSIWEVGFASVEV